MSRDAPPVAPPPPTSLKRRVLGVAVVLAVIAATFFLVLPRIADYGDVWDVVQRLTWWEIVLLAAATILNLVTFAPNWMAALPDLGFRQALVVTQASTASTYFTPGGAAPGVAVSFAMLRGWGFSRRSVALAVTLTSVWNQLLIFAFPIIALALLTAVGGSHPLLRTMALIGAVVFGAVVSMFAIGLSSDQLARRIGDAAARAVSRAKGLVRKQPVRWSGESLVAFRRETIGLLRRRWHALTAATLVGHLSVFLVLLVTLRVLGVSDGEVSWIEAFAAWSIVRVLGSLPITPGGIGIVELGLTSLLVGFGAGQPEAVAGTLLYRFLVIVPTLLLGLIAGATWRRHHPVREDRGAAVD